METLIYNSRMLLSDAIVQSFINGGTEYDKKAGLVAKMQDKFKYCYIIVNIGLNARFITQTEPSHSEYA